MGLDIDNLLYTGVLGLFQSPVIRIISFLGDWFCFKMSGSFLVLRLELGVIVLPGVHFVRGLSLILPLEFLKKV